jgi:YrbI family 3-deoxy-D-manno-octulosonate 8-phosphate phosphatase
MRHKISISDIDVFVFDFDGVLTNNLVYLDQDGRESVCLSRSDGLAFDALRKLDKHSLILSTEKNPVVNFRAEKLKIKAIFGVKDKAKVFLNLAERNGYNLDKVLYVGNDINDYNIMRCCGISVCPADSHIKIKEISDIVLNTCGGKGVVRELLEDVLGLNLIEILYND